MPPDSLQRRIEYIIRHDRWPGSPARIGLIVDVAVGAVQVTASGNLHDNWVECRVDLFMRRVLHRLVITENTDRRMFTRLQLTFNSAQQGFLHALLRSLVYNREILLRFLLAHLTLLREPLLSVEETRPQSKHRN